MLHARAIVGPARRHVYLLLIAIGFGALSLSSHVYWGSHEILRYSIPRLLHRLPDQFRSPGRFVWVPLYILIVFILHWAYSTLSSPRRFAIVVIAALVQLADARGDWALQSTWAHGEDPWPPRLAHGGWRALIAAHSAVAIHPTYSCIHDQSVPDLELVSTEIEMLVSERTLPINGTYSTRPTRSCVAEEQAWPAVALEPGTLYVLLPRATAIAHRFEVSGGSCGAFDQGSVCSANAAAITAAIAAGILRPPE
jgi:hypothetical protein